MIELRNLTKIYKSKKGTETKALDNVSVKFGETGMVFILGKSGSGKSTLLNVLGGLDSYNEGDLIVNGKSTRKFKQSEFDSYRNTYVGFVFQDFNLLDEYTVNENISLSLQLQGEKPTKAKIDEIVNLVELKGLENRKINELSGGQQQRVSIARALIKNPNIILADEPTGNLDSETSKQIFNLLKKLSKEKLIVVVSHDAESASQYADRIIEIKDGRIVDDTRAENEMRPKEAFKLRRAKLPFAYAIRLGLGSLKHKKIKLILTLLLLTFSTMLTGIMFSTNSFDIKQEHLNSVVANNERDIWCIKYNRVRNFYQEKLEEYKKSVQEIPSTNENNNNREQDFTDEELQNIENTTNVRWVKVSRLSQNGEDVTLNILSDPNELYMDQKVYYYDAANTPITFSELNDDYNVAEQSVKGRLPKESDEIVISNYLADCIIYYGVDAVANEKVYTYKPSNYEQIISDGKYIKLSGYKNVKIVGIIEYDLSAYEEIKPLKSMEVDSTRFGDVLLKLHHARNKFLNVYVTNTFFKDLKENYVQKEENHVKYSENTYTISQFGYVSNELEIFDGSQVTKVDAVKDNEVVITLPMLNTFSNGEYSNKLNEYMAESDEENTSVKEFAKQYIKNSGIIGKNIKSSIVNNENKMSESEFKEYTIKGVILDENEELDYVLFSKNIVKDLVSENKTNSQIYALVNNNDDLINICNNIEIDNSNILLNTRYSDILISNVVQVTMIRKYGIYGIVVSMIIAILLFTNFISNSISFRKKEIGILRAIGCKSMDVVKIFSVESLVVSALVLIISIPLITKIADALNGVYAVFSGGQLQIFRFGYLQLVVIIIYTILITLIINLIAVRKIAKKKPIDAILNK